MTVIANRREFVAGIATGVLILPLAARAQSGGVCTPSVAICAPISIKNLWVDGPNNTKTAAYNQAKGVLHFTPGRGNEQTLTAYWNKPDGPRQCVELIKRYAWLLRFYDFANKKLDAGDFGLSLPAMEDGYASAKKFAKYSNGGFSYVYNRSKTLPKAGAVLSVSQATGLPYGHVGIVCNYDSPGKNTTKVRIKIFEQNMKSTSWSEVEFVKRKDGTWEGTFYIGSKGYDVAGWADPNG